MENIIIKINKKTRMVKLSKTTIGNEGENLQNNFLFEFEDEFVNGQARLEYIIGGEKKYIFLEKNNNTYITPVKNFLTKKGTIDMQLVILEGVDENNVPIFKSNMFYIYCNSSINAEVEEPEEPQTWLEISSAKINQVDNLDIDIENSIVTITKKDGTIKTANVKGDKGEKGDAGSVRFIIVNELPTEDIDDSAIYMKPAGATTEDNTYEEYIYVDGVWESLGSANVNVDLADYVKKTDYATSTTAGAVKINSNFGITIRADGILMPSGPSKSELDDRTNTVRPLTPHVIDYSVKKALSDCKLTGNDVWTDEEKASARELLGLILSVGATKDTVALRDGDGRIYAMTPKFDSHVATKKYVDDKHVTLTQAEYDALTTKDENTFYYIVEE